MKGIDFSTSIRAINKFVQANNEKHSRYGDPMRINATRKSVMIALVKVWGSQLKKRNMRLKPGRPNKEELKYYEETPPCSTNNVELAKSVGCSPRTIRTHIKALLEREDFISKKIFHGTTSNYEVWINPELIEVQKTTTLIVTEINAQEDEERKIIALNETPNSKTSPEFIKQHVQAALQNKKAQAPRALKKPQEEKPASIIEVFSSEKENKLNSINWESEFENSQENQVPPANSLELKNEIAKQSQQESFLKESLPLHPGEEPESSTPGAAPATLGTRVAQKMKISRNNTAEAPPRPMMKDDAKFQPFRGGELLSDAIRLRDNLWLLIAKLLYKDMVLNDHEIDRAKDLILWYYAPQNSLDELRKHHEDYCQRVELAARWVKRKASRYIPIPTHYFDVRNKNGFLKTAQWKRAGVKLKIHSQHERFTKRMYLDYLLNPSPENYTRCLEVINEECGEFFGNRFIWYNENKISPENINLKH